VDDMEGIEKNFARRWQAVQYVSPSSAYEKDHRTSAGPEILQWPWAGLSFKLRSKDGKRLGEVDQ